MSERDPDQPDSPLPPRRAKQSPVGSWLGAWARDTFSREQLISSLKSFLWVAPLTILIWVYAEREQPDKVDNQVIIFAMKANDPRILIRMIDPPERSLMAELRGSRVQVDAVKGLLVPKSDQPPVVINISPEQYPPGGGPYTVPASIISDQDIFRNNSITVANVSPPQLKFSVDRIVSRDVEVQAPAVSATTNLAGAPVIEPRMVQITGPESVLDGESKKGNFRVTADFSNYPETKIPGKHELNVPLTLGFTDRDVTIAPATVKVSINVQELQRELKINAIRLNVTYPSGLEKQYRAEYDASLRFVTFYGPREVMEKMEQGNAELQPQARIEVGNKDITDPVGQDRKTRVKYDLPANVRVSPADADREITFKLVPQTAPE